MYPGKFAVVLRYLLTTVVVDSTTLSILQLLKNFNSCLGELWVQYISVLSIYDRLDFKIKKEAIKNIYSDSFSGSIYHTGHYYHENSTTLNTDFSYSDYKKIDEELDNIHSKVYDFLKDEIIELSKNIYKDLKSIYNEVTSEEYILENIEINDYNFTENGDIY
jgi:hypothetical protein